MKKQALIKPLAFLFLLIMTALVAYLSFSVRQYKNRLENVYKGAVLSILQKMDDVEHDINKVLLSENATSAARYLTHLSDSAGQAQRSLSLLPLSHPDTMQITKLTNQLADYARALMQKGSLSQTDIVQLQALTDACRQYAQILCNNEEMLANLSLETASFFPVQGVKTMDAGLSYPTLIYDGPFSDAAKETKLALQGDEISWQEAANIARAFVGEDRVRSLSPGADIRGPNPCHGITITLDDVVLEAAVTKQEGKILWLSPDSAHFPSRVTIEQCREEALAFLERNGFPKVACTGFQVYEGVAVLSFAPVEGDILLYPDLVKVQLRMDTAKPVGIETHAYRQNHRAREMGRPTLTEEEARLHLSPLLKPTKAQLCLIPQNGQEKMCWEFTCSHENQDFLLYINAHTGMQEELLQIIESDTGIGTV